MGEKEKSKILILSLFLILFQEKKMIKYQAMFFQI